MFKENIQNPIESASHEQSLEARELNHQLAAQLRNSEEGSYLKGLKRFAAGCVFAGMTFSQTSEAVAPVISSEKQAADSLKDLDIYAHKKQETRAKIKMVLEAFEMRGGVKESDQLELLGRPTHLGSDVFSAMRNVKIPYYLRPYVFLGEKFIHEHPEIAADYSETITKAIKSTVYIEAKGSGSGSIVKTKNGIIILTNQHVVKEEKKVYIEFAGQELCGFAEVKAVDKESDLAVLEITELFKLFKSKKLRKNEFEAVNGELADALKDYGIESLEIVNNKEFKEVLKQDTIVSVGNSSDYPFSSHIYKGGFMRENNVGKKINQKSTVLSKTNIQEYLYLKTDHRFMNNTVAGNTPIYELTDGDVEKKALARADAMNSRPGSSGGPTVGLEGVSKGKLIGLDSYSMKINKEGATKDYEEGLYSGLVTAISINKFLKDKGY